MNGHLPVLEVIIPLLGAPVCLLLGSKQAARLFAIAVAWITLAIAWQILGVVMDSGPFAYELGGFPPPWGLRPCQ